ncbi:MAG: hypothetical protein R6X22_11375 [Gemmatimonadota bacterium]
MTFASWLRFQLVLAAAGAGVWYAGAALDEPFVAGVGLGAMLSALAVRFARGGAPRDRDGDGA